MENTAVTLAILVLDAIHNHVLGFSNTCVYILFLAKYFGELAYWPMHTIFVIYHTW